MILNVHFHMLLLGSVHIVFAIGAFARVDWAREHSSGELTLLVHKKEHWFDHYMERGLERGAENNYLALIAADNDPLSVLLGYSITYHIALGWQAGRQVYTLRALSPEKYFVSFWPDSVIQPRICRVF